MALARSLRPDVCLFDIRMPVVDGLEATRAPPWRAGRATPRSPEQIHQVRALNRLVGAHWASGDRLATLAALDRLAAVAGADAAAAACPPELASALPAPPPTDAVSAPAHA